MSRKYCGESGSSSTFDDDYSNERLLFAALPIESSGELQTFLLLHQAQDGQRDPLLLEHNHFVEQRLRGDERVVPDRRNGQPVGESRLQLRLNRPTEFEGLREARAFLGLDALKKML